MTALSDCHHFPFLSSDEEAQLLAAASERSYAAEDLILDQGQDQHVLHVIQSGAVRVERADRGAMVPIATLGPGELFGEMSFVDGAKTSARVVAEESTSVRVIDGTVVQKLADASAGFEGRLYRSLAAIMATRLRLTSMRVYNDQSWG